MQFNSGTLYPKQFVWGDESRALFGLLFWIFVYSWEMESLSACEQIAR